MIGGTDWKKLAIEELVRSDKRKLVAVRGRLINEAIVFVIIKKGEFFVVLI